MFRRTPTVAMRLPFAKPTKPFMVLLDISRSRTSPSALYIAQFACTLLADKAKQMRGGSRRRIISYSPLTVTQYTRALVDKQAQLNSSQNIEQRLNYDLTRQTSSNV